MRITLLIIFLFLFCRCSQTGLNSVKVVLDKPEVQYGEVVTARLYVVHNDLIAPAFHLISHDNDTLNIPTDENDNYCGVIQIVGRDFGLNEYQGFVEILDLNNKRRTYNYTIRFKILKNNKNN